MSRAFNGYEMGKCAEYIDDSSSSGETLVQRVDEDFEIDEELADGSQPIKVFWSIYGHVDGEGAHCLGDFTTREHALEILALLPPLPYSYGFTREEVEAARYESEIQKAMWERKESENVGVVILVTEDFDGNLRASIHPDEADAEQQAKDFVTDASIDLKRHETITDYWNVNFWREHAADLKNLFVGPR